MSAVFSRLQLKSVQEVELANSVEGGILASDSWQRDGGSAGLIGRGEVEGAVEGQAVLIRLAETTVRVEVRVEVYNTGQQALGEPEQ